MLPRRKSHLSTRRGAGIRLQNLIDQTRQRMRWSRGEKIPAQILRFEQRNAAAIERLQPLILVEDDDRHSQPAERRVQFLVAQGSGLAHGIDILRLTIEGFRGILAPAIGALGSRHPVRSLPQSEHAAARAVP